MNYQLQLITGPDALFFLDEWPAGGVEIDERVVGLFDAAGPRRKAQLTEALALYGLSAVTFGLTGLLKVGFLRTWQWQDIRWIGGQQAGRVDEEARIRELLSPGLHGDPKRQIRLLQRVQATAKRRGTPTLVQGSVPWPGGRREKVIVYATGIVAYDRTPHPLEFLRDVASIASS